MAEPYLIEITQGETLAQEFRLVDDDADALDVTTATKTVRSVLLPGADFTFSSPAETGIFVIKATGAKTALWPPGIHLAQVWFDWGALADLRYERLFDLKFSVLKAIA